MSEQVTIIIILHNRHANLDRLLEFYENIDLPVFIADSSSAEHVFSKKKDSIKYRYTPGLTYTQKVEQVLNEIDTPYVAMCADDDFIIPGGLYHCVDFLEKNREYSAAQGMILKYHQNTIRHTVRFEMLYTNDHSLLSMDPLERLKKLFDPYKSLLYGVHRTAILRTAFTGAGKAFTNLYLNEYMTSVIPVLLGKYKDLPVLYQAREHAEGSDDKTVINLDTIVQDGQYKAELTGFLNHIVDKTTNAVSVNSSSLKDAVLNALENYALKIETFKRSGIPLKKRIGKLLSLIPFFGMRYLQKKRLNESNRSLKKYLSEQDFKELASLQTILKKHEV